MTGNQTDEDFRGFLAQVKASGGSEMANCQPFVERLCLHLGLPQPDFAGEENRFNDYVYERRVDFKHPDGTTTAGRVDLYKRDCFILEDKQSSKRAAITPALPGLTEEHGQIKRGPAPRGTRRWDRVMDAARKQAENYARALPVAHGYPPFLLVLDIGNELQVFADFSGQGKNYTQFPDRSSYRLTMDDLLDPAVQDRLRRIWCDPLSLDPARHSAQITQDIAERLARIAKRLEQRHDPHDVAGFLMRCLFTMFAEDVELLPDHAFEALLERMKDRPAHFAPALEDLWAKMDKGGYAAGIDATLRKFNGALFRNATALPLEADDIAELWVASQRSWQDVEPAIFGTLLERALDPRDRSRLGAHYTPRVYVERLVIPTVIQPLRADWDAVRLQVKELQDNGKEAAALKAARDYHHRLCTVRVLDPACGTGNFLYVALELMKRLEGEVLEVIADLAGGEQSAFDLAGETVNPSQFHGIELNPRAVPIADLVLWIGYLKWQLRTSGPASIAEPILHAYGTIREGDAILASEGTEPVTDAAGAPVHVWDGVTTRPNPVAPEQTIPDPTATVPMVRHLKPKPAPWPEVEFIVGNPPFIGGKDMRAELGDGYVEAVWAARPDIPGGADFVMHFWDAAATRLLAKGTKARPNPLRRFGFITTNSITQTFSRRVIERHMKAKAPLSLVYAVADHPWQKSAGKAAVRIAMTVAEAGEAEGVLGEVIAESALNTDVPQVDLRKTEGKITAKLTLGADLSRLKSLWANDMVCRNGMMLAGAGFQLDPKRASVLSNSLGSDALIRPYVNGSDLTRKIKLKYVIDAFDWDSRSLQKMRPDVFQHLYDNVKPHRDQNRRKAFRERWWVFGEPRKTFRPALKHLERMIATTETAKHRFFQFLSTDIVPDHMIVAIGLDDAAALAVLSSRLHTHFAIHNGGWLGVGNDPRYSKSRTFDPFPFPTLSDPLRACLADLGERLDAFRKGRLAAHAHLTMTGLYNALERLRELEAGIGDPMTEAERDTYDAGQIRILAELHDEIDRTVLDAYGWADLAPALVGRVGGTLPSLHKDTAQEAAEEELLSRLVALNEQRALEEAQGDIKWLRPDYQVPRLGKRAPQPAMDVATAKIAAIPDAAKPAWPRDAMDQIRILRRTMAGADEPLSPAELSARFKGGRRRQDRVGELLRDMVELGIARTDPDRGSRFFLPD